MSEMPLARIHAPNDIRLDHVARPIVGDDDVLIEVVNCGICGSDLSYSAIGGIPGAASPFALGHEFSGRIVDIGRRVEGFAMGERVVVNPEYGGNRIGSGGHKGAFAPHLLYNNAREFPDGIMPLPEHIDFELAALIEPLAVGMHAVRQSRLKPGDRVSIFGAGPVGLAAALAARYFGGIDVAVFDLSAKRLGIAKQLGFTCYNAAENETAAALMELHGVVHNDPLLGPQPATDILIEATGHGPVFQQICDSAKKGARIVVVGVHFAPVELNMINLLMKELQITAATQYPEEFPLVIKMLGDPAFNQHYDARQLITDRYALSEFNQAFAQAKRQDQSLKVMVDCQS